MKLKSRCSLAATPLRNVLIFAMLTIVSFNVGAADFGGGTFEDVHSSATRQCLINGEEYPVWRCWLK